MQQFKEYFLFIECFDNMFTDSRLFKDREAAKLYELYKLKFIGYISDRYGIQSDDAMDIYHDSFLQMVRNIEEGKYRKMEASLFTYLIGIGRNLTLKRIENSRESAGLYKWMDEIISDADWGRALDEACRIVSDADTACNKVLQLFYWHRANMGQIAQAMGYQSASVAKNKKMSCMRRFAAELKKRLTAMGIYYKLKNE